MGDPLKDLIRTGKGWGGGGGMNQSAARGRGGIYVNEYI